MALETYREKRDFTATAEPAGSDRRGHGDAFVVQKHAARRLHYDLRLEIGDVLASWAVTRGPSLVPGEKRLAVHVEDHPLDYADFEGTIAQGQYGGGEVIVWDRGRWQPEGDPVRGLKKGRLDFTLEGAKLKGRWHLVRMAAKRGEKRENWLLIKGSDDDARTAADPDILTEAPASVISGRTIDDIAAGKPAPEARRREGGRHRLPRLHPPGARHPETEAAPWRRLGARDQVRRLPAAGTAPRRQGAASSPAAARTGPTASGRVAAALAALPATTAILDGELVVEGAAGASDFSALQADLSAGRTDRFRYYALRPPLPRRRGSARRAADAPQGPARGTAPGRCRAAPLQRALRRGRRGDAATTPAGSASRAWSPSGATPLSLRPQPAPGSSRSAPTARSSSSPATSVLDRVEGRSSARWCSATTRTASSCMSAASAPASAARWPATWSRRPRAAQPQDVTLRRQAARRRRPRRHLGPARAGRRGRVPRLDRRRPPAPRRLPRPARGQAGGEVTRETEPSPADPARAAGTPHPSRPRLLARRRRHQAGPRRLLRRGLAADGATSGQPPAGAPALPGRHRRPVLLPETRLEGPEPRDPDLPTTRRRQTTSR